MSASASAPNPESATASRGQVARANRSDTLRLLRTVIQERELLPGERLGSERQIASQLGVTRADLRIALAALESSHEVLRRIGRGGGIIVSDSRLERNINTVESLPIIARRQGRILKSDVVSAMIAPATCSDVRLLGLDRVASGALRNIFDITRVRYVDGTPLSLEISHLPADLFPGFLTKDLTTSFYARFADEYGIHPAVVDETLESIIPSKRQAELLRVDEGTPLMRIRRVARTQEGRPFERATDVYVASRMRFTMHHSGYVRLSATVPQEPKQG
jgi:GntR family transcriptional regulator